MSTSTHNRNSSGDTVKVGPIRKGKKILTFNSDDDSVAKLRQNVLSTASCTDVNINTTLAEERDTIDESRLKPVPLRNFVVGNKSSTNVRPNNGFLRSGYTGCLRKVRSTPNFDMHSKELMKTGVGKELREEDTKYGRNMVKALSSRGHIMGKKLLFLGSGCAKVINFFFARGPQSAVCVDASPIKIARLRENTELLGYSSFVSSICCSATDVDAYVSCGETFDTIIITKAMGAICSNSQKKASDILAVAKSILSEDGVIFVDSQTGDLGTRGKLSEFFGSKDAGVATIWGRYDDNVYNVHECAETASLTVREQFKLNIRKNDGHLKDCAAQIWVGYIVGKRRDVHVPLVPKVSKNQKVIKLKDFDLVMKGGIDMLPKGTNGVKLVPWQGVSLQVTQFPIYPKFDGIAGVLICSDGMATFSSSIVTMALGVTKTKNDYLFLSELCRVSIENHKPHWVPVILGIISINGVKYDPNDMSVLERERSEFEDYYSRHGILVTGPNMLFSLKGDTIRHQCETKDSRKRVMEIPVDGLNVFIGGGHGNFLKPISRITLDIDSESTRNFYDAMKLIDSDDFDLPEVKEGVWEYRLEGMDFVPFRRRNDKVTGNGTIRTAQDINSLIKTSELFSYVKDTSGLYTYLIDTFNTYQPTREEDKKFFTDNYFK